MSKRSHGGRGELGQNFLVAPGVIADFCRATERAPGPIIEIGPGDGALTIPLSRLGRPIIALEVDPEHARSVDRRTDKNVTVVNDDFLRYRLPAHPHVVVGNIPFHITTAIVRRLLVAPHWQQAVLIVQWEVARRRAGIGGASLLTASWWPWYEFGLLRRVPARAFRPVPSVDGGILTIARRNEPLVGNRGAYQQFVKEIFTGPGRGLAQILTKTGRLHRTTANRWLTEQGAPYSTLPKELTAAQWASLWHVAQRETQAIQMRPMANRRRRNH